MRVGKGGISTFSLVVLASIGHAAASLPRISKSVGNCVAASEARLGLECSKAHFPLSHRKLYSTYNASVSSILFLPPPPGYHRPLSRCGFHTFGVKDYCSLPKIHNRIDETYLFVWARSTVQQWSGG